MCKVSVSMCVHLCTSLVSLSLSVAVGPRASLGHLRPVNSLGSVTCSLASDPYIYRSNGTHARMWNVLCLFAHEGAQQPREGQGQVQKVRAPLNQSCSDEYTASRDPITQEHKWKCCTNIKLARQSGGAAALALSILAAQTWSAVSPEETTTPESADTNVAQTRWCPHALLQKNFSISKSRLGTSLNFWANS